MEANQWENWEKVRAKGTWHYVLVYGFLFWSIPYSILMWIWQYFRSSDPNMMNRLFEFDYLLFHFGLSLIFGFVLAMFNWFFSETAYQRSRKNKDFNIWIPKQKDNLK